jgi:acid phosphatase type 7
MKTIGGTCRAALLIAAAATALAFASGAQAQYQNSQGQGPGGGPGQGPNSNDNTWPYAQAGRLPVLAVVGDISCQPGAEGPGEAASEVCSDPATPPPYTSTSLWQSQEATASQIEGMKPDAVALLGDLQYQVGRYSDFEQSFDLTYGAFKFLHRPAPGNHEFYDEHGETGVGGYGYFSYYNGFLIDTTGDANTGKPLTATISDPCPVPSASCKAGKTPTADLVAQPIPRSDGQAGHFEQTGGLETSLLPAGGPVGVGDGWYSYNLGSWHLISLNIECYTQPGGCSAMGSWFAAELAWLKKDLEENHSACTAAYWHQPLFSPDNGITQEGATSQAFWQLLYDFGADVVLNGHDHLYARYRPLDPSGNFDPRNGIREFVVGTGGETLDTVVTTDTTTADPTGNPNFNAQNLQSATGNFWGVMSLTLGPNGYAWNFQPALTLPGASGTFQDQGFATCHGGPFQGGGPGPGDRDHDGH